MQAFSVIQIPDEPVQMLLSSIWIEVILEINLLTLSVVRKVSGGLDAEREQIGKQILAFLSCLLLRVVPQDSVERLGGGYKRSGTYPELACPPIGLKRSGDGGKAVPISIQPCRAGDDRRS